MFHYIIYKRSSFCHVTTIEKIRAIFFFRDSDDWIMSISEYYIIFIMYAGRITNKYLRKFTFSFAILDNSNV